MSTTVTGDTGTARHELDPLAELADSGDPTGLRGYLEGLGVRVNAVGALPQWNVDDEVTTTFRDALAARQRLIESVLGRALDTVSGTPYGAVRLFAYLAVECQETWEVSYSYEPIWATLVELRRQWTARRPWRDEPEKEAGEAVLELVDNVFYEIHSENLMTCGLLREAGAVYRQAQVCAAAATARAVALRERAEDDRAAVGTAIFVQSWVATSIVFDEAVAWAADGIAEFLGGSELPADTGPLAAAESQLLESYLDAETFPADKEDGQYWSELRSHRFDVDALRAMRDDPWLYVDDGTIVYLYPFALRPPTGSARARAEYDAYETKLRHQVDEVPGWALGGEVPTEVRLEFRLDDVWQGTDAAGRRFDGVRLELPEVTLSGPTGDGAGRDDADEEPPLLATLQAEIRLSKLGNHFVRFEGRLRDATASDLFAALRRPAPEHGAFVVGYGAQVWPRLSTLAMELISDLAGHLGAVKTAREGMFQVLVTVDAASTGTGPAADRADRTEIRAVEQVRSAAGAPVLFNAVSHVMTSLAEWSRYDIAGDHRIDDGTARKGRAIIRTTNTTVHLALGAPHWELGTAVSLSEFVASLEGLFAGWMDELNDFQAQVNEQRRRVDTASTTDAEHLRIQVEELRRVRLDLQTFLTDCRSTIALINSPALVRSPVVAANLAGLVEAGGFRRRVAEFEGRAAEILSDRLDEIIERAARDKEDAEDKARAKAENQHRTRMDTLLAIIAAVGVSGLGQILQAGYGLEGSVSLEITLGIVLLAFVVGVTVWLGARAVRRQASVARSARSARSAVPSVPKQTRTTP